MRSRLVKLKRLNDTLLFIVDGEIYIIINPKVSSNFFRKLLAGDEFSISPSGILIYTTKERYERDYSAMRAENIMIPVLIPAEWSHGASFELQLSRENTWYIGELFEVRYICNRDALIPVIWHNPMGILFGVLLDSYPPEKIDLLFDILITNLSYDDLLVASDKLNIDARYVLSFIESRNERYRFMSNTSAMIVGRTLTDIVFIPNTKRVNM